jgi:hypothetical protein
MENDPVRDAVEAKHFTPASLRKKWGDPGSKVTRATSASVFSAGKRKPVIVTLYPDGIIGLRLSRYRKEEYVDAANVYREAVVARVASERAAKRKGKKREVTRR